MIITNESSKQLITLPKHGIDKYKVRLVLGDRCHFGLIIITLFFGSLCLFGFVSDMKDIYPDFTIFQNPEYIEADVNGKCHKSEKRRRNKFPPVECSFSITYEGKTYYKAFSYSGSLADTYNVRAVRSQDDHSLISADLALKHITAIFLRNLIFLFVGSILSLCALYLIINRLKVTYFKFELNFGDSNLVLIPIDHLRELGKGSRIRYNNHIGKIKIKTVYGDIVGSKGSDPYSVFRNNRSYVLTVRNKNTGNFLVVDEQFKRFRLRGAKLQDLRLALSRDNRNA